MSQPSQTQGPATVGLRVVGEECVTAAERAAVLAILPSHWQASAASAGRAYTQQRPAWRILATALHRTDAGTAPTEELVGQLSLVALSASPAVLGIADLCVAVAWRRTGLASQLLTRAAAEADRLGVAAMADSMNGHVRRVLERLGFVAVTGEASLRRRDERGDMLVVPPGWMVRGELSGCVLDQTF